VLAQRPTESEALAEELNCCLKICDWAGVEAALAAIRALPAGTTAVHPFVLMAVLDDPAELLRSARCVAASAARGRSALPATLNYSHERIRVAYLSSDYCVHATSFLIAELLELHDRARFEIFGVSYGPDDESAVRRRMIEGCDVFADVSAKSDLEIARWLREHEIDIAVDLKGYTAFGRSSILAHRPAPIQVNYLGYPGTLGGSFDDYIVADEFLIPETERRHYEEKIAYLPGSYQVNDRQRVTAAAGPTRAEAGLPEEAFVFCCFNNNWKITAPVFDVWMRLLSAVEGSVLWLFEDNETAAANLRAAAAGRGVAPERLVFARRIQNEVHLARHRLADLFLDTVPVNAHTTASDALWSGLPVVTCAGRTFAGRVAGSLLRAVGLAELVTSSLGEYEELARSLARDPSRLRAMRNRLLENRRGLPLFDTPSFCRHLEAAYGRMWTTHQQGRPPATFTVAADSSVRERR
jgi:predicted O-linked N-acetylglucosamine transferase (SPINDLY family)